VLQVDHRGGSGEKYRADIDGLRAVAVLLVVGFHIFPYAFPGGFIGVDIFFVISGYLISSIILTEANAGTFSFVAFYARRAKRILPALTSVSAVAIVVYAQVFYAPQILRALQSLVASFLFSANVYFYATTDYFAPSINEFPFLHYWSLGVEEQYYLIFPLLVLLLSRLSQRIQIAAFVVLSLISLIGSEIVLRVQPPAAYYLIPWRAWELMLGTIVYFILARPSVTFVTSPLSFWLGLAAITSSAWSLNASSRFPGFAALPACVGAALIITSGARRQWIGNRLFGSSPLNYLGRISYSLYLIHWPVYVILSADSFAGTAWNNPIVMLALSLIFAVINYTFVEQPLRRLPAGRNVIVAAACLIGFVLILSAFGIGYYHAKVERARHFRDHLSSRLNSTIPA